MASCEEACDTENIKTDDDDATEVRRSSRRHKGRSARELLGIKRRSNKLDPGSCATVKIKEQVTNKTSLNVNDHTKHDVVSQIINEDEVHRQMISTKSSAQQNVIVKKRDKGENQGATKDTKHILPEKLFLNIVQRETDHSRYTRRDATNVASDDPSVTASASLSEKVVDENVEQNNSKSNPDGKNVNSVVQEVIYLEESVQDQPIPSQNASVLEVVNVSNQDKGQSEEVIESDGITLLLQCGSNIQQVEQNTSSNVVVLTELGEQGEMLQVLHIQESEDNSASVQLNDQDADTQDAVATLIKLEDPVHSARIHTTQVKTARQKQPATKAGSNSDMAPVKPVKINPVSKMARKLRTEPQAVELSEELQSLVKNLQPTDTLMQHFTQRKDKKGRRCGLRCNHCPEAKYVNTKVEALAHISTHMEFKPFKCPLCDYTGQLRSHIRRHINVHSKAKAYVCELCGRGFNFRQKLQIHMKYHRDERDHVCPHCDLAFHEYKTLKNHILRIHKDEDETMDLSQMKINTKGRTGLLGTKKTQKLTKLYQNKLVEEAAAEKSGDISAKQHNQPAENEEPSADEPTEAPGEFVTHELTTLHADSVQAGVRTENGQPTIYYINVGNNGKKRKKKMIDWGIEEELYKFIEKIPNKAARRNVIYQCKLCKEEFPIKTKVINHLESQHKDVKIWSCPVCVYRCRVRSNLMVHLKLHTGVKNYVCKICGKAFSFKQKLDGHMKFHLNLREYKCDICPSAFNHRNDLTKHKQRVHCADRPEKCETCGKCFQDKLVLKRHMQGHAQFKTFLCEVCKKFYQTKQSLQQHMKSHTHMFHCEICDKNFGSYSGFMAHKVMHDESYGGYVCPQCSKVLHTKGSLQRHIKVFHTSDRPHDCPSCDKSFKSIKDLRNHKVVHDTSRPYKCSMCDHSSKRLESLRVHMRKHTTSKPYQCGICQKQYTQRHALEVHLRFHEGANKGHCALCDKTFANKYQLDQHVARKHPPATTSETSESPNVEEMPQEGATDSFTVFMCEECNSVFLSQDNLAIHILADHFKHGYVENDNANKPDDVESVQQVALSAGGNQDTAQAFTIPDQNHSNSDNLEDIMAENAIATTATAGDVIAMDTGDIMDESSTVSLNTNREENISIPDGQSFVTVAEIVEIPIDQHSLETQSVPTPL